MLHQDTSRSQMLCTGRTVPWPQDVYTAGLGLVCCQEQGMQQGLGLDVPALPH